MTLAFMLLTTLCKTLVIYQLFVIRPSVELCCTPEAKMWRSCKGKSPTAPHNVVIEGVKDYGPCGKCDDDKWSEAVGLLQV